MCSDIKFNGATHLWRRDCTIHQEFYCKAELQELKEPRTFATGRIIGTSKSSLSIGEGGGTLDLGSGNEEVGRTLSAVVARSWALEAPAPHM